MARQEPSDKSVATIRARRAGFQPATPASSPAFLALAQKNAGMNAGMAGWKPAPRPQVAF